ncbi:hypothetical protein HDV02_004545 [Globomyces sp. JEL0801]|nr:hypothetical protein HDV02_004545 [Globomyces sp. JEL0801]
MDDKSTLISMGFPEKKVLKALKVTKNAGLQPAMDWLIANSDKPDNDDEDEEDQGEITPDQVTAQSLKCDDCDRLLRDATAAEMHAIKTGHQNFSESTSIIKPLTAEEKAKKLEELKKRMELRKEEKRLAEIEEQKNQEKVRRTTGVEMQAIREKLEAEEMAKQVELRRREKEEDRIAKALIRKQLEADKLERKRLAEEKKLLAQGIQPEKPVVKAAPVVKDVNYSDARIQIRIPNAPPLTHTFDANDKLSVVYQFVRPHYSGEFKLFQTFPRKALDGPCLDQTLKDLKLVPSAALVLQ